MSGAPGRIVVGEIEPIDFKKVRFGSLAAKSKEHAPDLAPPDLDNPITRAMLGRLPELTYGELETIRSFMMNAPDGGWISSMRDVDTWLALVNAELQTRDKDREAMVADFFGWLKTRGGVL